MKIEVEKQISPIKITLETQEEIDQLFAVLNFEPIANAISTSSNNWNIIRTELQRYKSHKYHNWHKKLEDIKRI